MFRVEVRSCDGHKCGIPVQIDDHPAEARSYLVNQIADSLLIRRKEIYEVLKSGTAEQLQRHLAQHTKEQLKPLRFRKDHASRRPFPF
jgi:hypothetical protein